MKRIISLLVVLTIYGCGVASKDVVSESKPLSAITVYALTDKGISISDNNSATWTKLIQKTRLNNLASSLMNDLSLFQNTLVIATEHGLSVSSSNATYVNYLENNNILRVLSTATTLYLATDTGLYSCTGNYSWQQLSPTATIAIAINNNTLYAAQQKTLNQIDLTSNTSLLRSVSDNIIALAVQGNNLLTLTNKGLYINTTFNDTLGAQACTALFVDNKKNIWVACDLGLAKSSDGKTWMIFDTNNGLPKANINQIYVDNLNIYLATDNGLIQSVNGGETWKTYQRQQGLVSSKILKVLVIK